MIEPKVSFAEFIEMNKDARVWIDALTLFASVTSPIEERPLEEWNILLKQLKNKPIKD